MNTPIPFFNPSFTFLSPNPIPNPNFSYANSEPLPPQSFSNHPPIPPNSNPDPNLHNTLSNLKNLIDLAETTLKSISENVLSSKKFPVSNEEDFCSCPFNPHHRMPPEFLFRHTLSCPSSPAVIDLSILESLHYPNSFKFEAQLCNENSFVQSLQESDAELCFSIDGFGEFGLNFFYKDCPGVVCYPELDDTKSTFTLPSVLSVQCANFRSIGSEKNLNSSIEFCRILPSELCALRREMESWNDYPRSYSFTVLRMMLWLPMVKESESLKWIISNSPRYGVVIDVPMSDHIYLLLKLCLRAISLEAYHSGELNPMPLTFSCPVLGEVMGWLTAQLSVLYGEPNGKFFSRDMLKNCMFKAASSLLLFSSEERKSEPCEKENLPSGENARGGSVFVSQVAAAIAALHERYLLEEKIKGLWRAGSLPKSQLINEHSYVTMKADEERRRRSNYKPILEHDGLLWQRSRNQDSSKAKTEEERLAEERDYKRRRVSYRGKKVKRKTTEVMRDIIEEHMEEIKHAGGIGCFVKGSAETGALSPGSVYVHDLSAKTELKRNECDPSGQGRQSDGYSKRLHFDYSENMSKRSYDLNNSHQRQRQESHSYHEPLEDHKHSLKEKRDREHRPKREESYRNHERSNERHRNQSKHDEIDVTKTNYDKKSYSSSHRSKHRESRHSSSLSSSSVSSHRKYDQISESKDRYREKTYGTHRSKSLRETMFDRYDPSKSDCKSEDAYDDESSGSKYASLDKEEQ